MRKMVSSIQPGSPTRSSMGKEVLLGMQRRSEELMETAAKTTAERDNEDLKGIYLLCSIKAHNIKWGHPGIWKGSVDADVIGALMAVGELGFDLDTLRQLYDKDDENALRANRRALDMEAEEKIPGAISVNCALDPDYKDWE
jgi:hypothetical protein